MSRRVVKKKKPKKSLKGKKKRLVKKSKSSEVTKKIPKKRPSISYDSKSFSKRKHSISSVSSARRGSVSSSDQVQVAVRVRPLNGKEKRNKDSVIVSMMNSSTLLRNPYTGQEKRFTFDFSYDSISKQEEKFSTNYDVYNDLGKQVIKQSFDGYNSCIFAYGQTGSGKSYTQFGTHENPGIIPLLCHDLFDKIEFRKLNEQENINKSSLTKKSTEFRVEVSMIEIYNEKIRDLFTIGSRENSQNLRIREHPKRGPYVENLTTHVCKNVDVLDRLLREGCQLRTIGQTSMNNTSSRAHTIFQITFTQVFKYTAPAKNSHKENSPPKRITIINRRKNKKKSPNKKKAKPSPPQKILSKKNLRVSKINLIDLAGSEQQSKAQTSGIRLKEGSAINLSLTMLGNVIKELSNGSKFVSYRNSKLTWLLKESLGGNSKTIMLATISPASSNYVETDSTLKYADRAKSIKNKAIVNEDSQSKLINDLRSEIKRLKNALSGYDGKLLINNFVGSNSTRKLKNTKSNEGDLESMEELQDQLRQNKSLIFDLEKTDSERLEETEILSKTREKVLRNIGIFIPSSNHLNISKNNSDSKLLMNYNRKEFAHFVNLNEDSFLNESLIYFLPKNRKITKIGSDRKKNDIILISQNFNFGNEEIEGEGEIEEEENKIIISNFNTSNSSSSSNGNGSGGVTSILSEHCEIKVREINEYFEYSVKPLNNSLVFINSRKISKEFLLNHNDKLILGNYEKYFRFSNPCSSSFSKNSSSNNNNEKQSNIIDWEKMKEEIELSSELEMKKFIDSKKQDYEEKIKKRLNSQREVEKLRMETSHSTEFLISKNFSNEMVVSSKKYFEKQKYSSIEKEVNKFKMELMKEKNEKDMLEGELKFLESQKNNLKNTVKMQNLEIRFVSNEKRRMIEIYKKEKSSLNRILNTLTDSISQKKQEILSIVKSKTQITENLRNEINLLDFEYLKKDRLLIEEQEKKKSLEEELGKLENANKLWVFRNQETGKKLKNKEEEFRRELTNFQIQITNNDIEFPQKVKNLQNLLSMNYIRMTEESEKLDQEIEKTRINIEDSETSKLQSLEYISEIQKQIEKEKKEVRKRREVYHQIEKESVGDFMKELSELSKQIKFIENQNKCLQISNKKKTEEVNRLTMKLK